MNMLFEVFKKEELSESQKLGAVLLLDKKGKCLLDIKSWRPLKCFVWISHSTKDTSFKVEICNFQYNTTRSNRLYN